MAKKIDAHSKETAKKITGNFYKEIREKAGIKTASATDALATEKGYPAEPALLQDWDRFSGEEYKEPERGPEKDFHSVYEQVRKAFETVTALDGYAGDAKGTFCVKCAKTYQRAMTSKVEEKLIGYVCMSLAYAIYVHDYKGKAGHVRSLVELCADKVGLQLKPRDTRFEFDGTAERLERITALLIAATLRVVFSAQRVLGETAPSSDNDDDIAWFLNYVGMGQLTLDKGIEKAVLDYVWQPSIRKTTFDLRNPLPFRGDITLSDYYVVPKLSCEDAGFVLDKLEGAPVRSALCSPSGFGKSTLFHALLLCSTLQRAIDLKVDVVDDDRVKEAYQKLQIELMQGTPGVFPQLFPVIVTGQDFSETECNDFIEIFAKKVFPRESDVASREALCHFVRTRESETMLFLDAFDEVKTERRTEYVKEFKRVSQSTKFNILLSYRPFLDEGLLYQTMNGGNFKKWRIEPLRTWGEDTATGKDKLWLLVRKTTDSLSFNFRADESDQYADRICERICKEPLLQSFCNSPFLMTICVFNCFASKNSTWAYSEEKTTYELLYHMVKKLFERFNYGSNQKPKLTGVRFRDICVRLSLPLISRESTIIPRAEFLNFFEENIDFLKFTDENYSEHFKTQVQLEEINTNSGVLILDHDRGGFVFQGHNATLPFLAAQAIAGKIYNVVFKHRNDADDAIILAISSEIDEVIAKINDEHAGNVVMLLADLLYAGDNKFFEGRIKDGLRPLICEKLIQMLSELGVSEEQKAEVSRKIGSKLFAVNALQE